MNMGHKSLRWATGLCLLAGLSSGAAHAQVGPEVQAQALQWLRQAVQESQASAAVPLRLEVSVGELDPRLKLAPCGNTEVYQPVGARLWGKTRLGVRCVDGMSRWNVSLPATVKATGPAWVVRNPVAVGSTIAEADVILAEVDWAAEADPIVSERSQWVDQIAARSLTAGQALRRTMLKPAQVFQAGALVRVVAQGVGFQVASEGQALTAGIVGQPARVRMDNGRVSAGVVVNSRTVRIDL
jgi:flagella basal body P-ring formation protein FlgA